MAFLTLAQLEARTKLTSLIEESTALKEFWLDVVNGFLGSFNLDENAEGFSAGLQYVAQQLVESLSINNSQQNVLAANSPFQSEKIGSYSYALKRPLGMNEEDINSYLYASLTPMARAILNRYMGASDSVITHSTTVFEEQQDNIIGFR